jgi:hypothetical protein
MPSPVWASGTSTILVHTQRSTLPNRPARLSPAPAPWCEPAEQAASKARGCVLRRAARSIAAERPRDSGRQERPSAAHRLPSKRCQAPVRERFLLLGVVVTLFRGERFHKRRTADRSLQSHAAKRCLPGSRHETNPNTCTSTSAGMTAARQAQNLHSASCWKGLLGTPILFLTRPYGLPP